MHRATLIRRLKLEENLILHAYHDMRGFLTIGWGHKVVSADGLERSSVITLTEANQYLCQDVRAAIAAVAALYPAWESYPEPVQQVLVHMAFNLGQGHLTEFHALHVAVQAGDWKGAAAAILDSLAAQQFPLRYARLAAEMANA